MPYARSPLYLRNVEDLPNELGLEISHETVRPLWNSVGPIFAAEIRRKRVDGMRSPARWRWHPDKVFGQINGRHIPLGGQSTAKARSESAA
jgi:putative transposase